MSSSEEVTTVIFRSSSPNAEPTASCSIAKKKPEFKQRNKGGSKKLDLKKNKKGAERRKKLVSSNNKNVKENNSNGTFKIQKP